MSRAFVATVPSPTFRVQYLRKGQEVAEDYRMAAPPQFAPGFVILTALSGVQIAYPAEIFAHLSWNVAP